MGNDKIRVTQRDTDLLREGRPPEDPAVLDAITVGQTVWEGFAVKQYLAPGGYIGDGCSQIKFIIGRPGAGKTHLLRRLAGHAQRLGYISVLLSATELRFQHIDRLYVAIAEHLNLAELARRLASRAVAQLGYDLDDVPTNTTFLSWAVQRHQRVDSFVRREVHEAVERLFKRESVDHNFSGAFTQLALDILGTDAKRNEDRDLLFRWLRGHKLRAQELQRIYLARSNDRYSARDMIHALADFVRQHGYAGLFVAIDQMEDMTEGRNPETHRLKYTSSALADAYQTLREMVDNLPLITSMLVVLAGRPEFLERPRGIKSYDALWLRIQHEVVSARFNRFAQVVDLDRAVEANLAPADVQQLHERLSRLDIDTRPLDELPIENILAASGGDGIYQRIMRAMTANHETR